jgi:hypothetical protein
MQVDNGAHERGGGEAMTTLEDRGGRGKTNKGEARGRYERGQVGRTRMRKREGHWRHRRVKCPKKCPVRWQQTVTINQCQRQNTSYRKTTFLGSALCSIRMVRVRTRSERVRKVLGITRTLNLNRRSGSGQHPNPNPKLAFRSVRSG